MPFLNAPGNRGAAVGHEKPLPAPEIMRVAPTPPPAVSERRWRLAHAQHLAPFVSPDAGSWQAKLVAAWRPSDASPSDPFGEDAAIALLTAFVRTKMARYENARGMADARAVSKLSPYLHFGQLSARGMMAMLRKANCAKVSKTFYRRLVWRDLAYWQLHHWPDMATVGIRAFYNDHAWRHAPFELKRWREGNTGFPLVDAGMRELWATGWMQQNSRMCVALFLTEYLNVSWVEGLQWFHDALFDADLAINAMMWQNAGKSGLDQWNFTVGPTAKSLDPTGDYIRRWVPEVAELPNAHIHAPWDAPAGVLSQAGIVLGQNYPERIPSAVDVRAAKERNLEALHELRAGAKRAGFVDKDGYDVIKVPQGACRGHNNGRIRVFTKPELRRTLSERDANERGGANGGARGAGASARRQGGRQRKQGRTQGGAQGGGRRGKGDKKLRQMTLEEMVRLGEMR